MAQLKAVLKAETTVATMAALTAGQMVYWLAA